MTRFTRRWLTVLILAGAGTGCSDDSKPTGTPPPVSEKALSKEKMPYKAGKN